MGRIQKLNIRDSAGFHALSLMIVIGSGLWVLGLAYVHVIKKRDMPVDYAKSVLVEHFPNTTFSKVEYIPTLKLFQVEAAETVIYLSKDGDFVFVGDVIDIESKVNLTQTRRDELSGVVGLERDIMGGSAKTRKAPPNTAQQANETNQAGRSRGRVAQVSLEGLDIANAVVKGEPGGKVIYVVSDFSCPYCQRLDQTLSNMSGIEIREIPVAYLGQQSALKGASVLCSDDRAEASSEMYGSRAAKIVTCSDGELAIQNNTAWAKGQGIGGTPAILDAEGRVLSGAQPENVIREFLGET